MAGTVKERLVRSTKWNFLGYVLLIVIGLAVARWIVRNLGAEIFGMWVVLEATVGYFGFVDLGLRTSFVRYIARFWGQEDTSRINHFVNTGAIAYFVFAVVIAVMGVSLFPHIASFLKIPPEFLNDAFFVFVVALTVFALDNLLRPFTAVLGGLQRYDIENKLRIAGMIIYGALVFVAITQGYGIRGVVLASAVRFLFISATSIYFSFRLIRGLVFNPLLFQWKMVGLMIRFGLKLQIVKLEELITYNTDSVVLAHFLGVTSVAFYNLGYRISNQVRRICLMLDSVIVPATSELDARSDNGRIVELYFRATKYLCFAAMGALAFVLVGAPMIMRVWIGEGYGLSVLTMRLLALSYFMTIFSEIGRSIAIGINRMSFYLKLSVVHAALNLGLSIWLVMRIGFSGVLYGTLIAYSLTSIMFVILFHRMLGLSLAAYARNIWLKAGIASAVPAAAMIAVNHLIWGAFPMTGMRCLVLLLSEGVLFLAVYLALIRRSRFFDSYDIHLIHEKIPFSRKVRLLG